MHSDASEDERCSESGEDARGGVRVVRVGSRPRDRRLGSEDVDAREMWRSRGICGPRATRDVPTRFASLAA